MSPELPAVTVGAQGGSDGPRWTEGLSPERPSSLSSPPRLPPLGTRPECWSPVPSSDWYILPNYYFVQPSTAEGEKIRGREERAETSIMKFLNHRAPAVNIFPDSKSIKYCFIPQAISNV